MELKLDQFGRVVIPKQIREHLHLVPGSRIEIEEHDNKLTLKPISDDQWFKEKNGILVCTSKPTGEVSSALL